MTRTLAALAESEERVRSFIEEAPSKMWVAAPDGTIEFFNRQWREYAGFTSGQTSWIPVVHPDDLQHVTAIRASAIPRGERYSLEVRLRRRDGRYRLHFSDVRPIWRNGVLDAWVGMSVDIDDIKTAERVSREAAERQAFMTREVEHRVKNNLSMITALLNLEARETASPEAKTVLSDIGHRIEAIVSVHDQLWRHEPGSIFPLDHLLRDLCTRFTAMTPCHDIIFRDGHKPIAISADRAVTVALVVNELITNAVKYAYPGDTGGPVTVTLAAEQGGGLRVEVEDRGVGLPTGVEEGAGRHDHLGTMLITAFTRQLEGELLYENAHPGTRAILRMPLEAPHRAAQPLRVTT